MIISAAAAVCRVGYDWQLVGVELKCCTTASSPQLSHSPHPRFSEATKWFFYWSPDSLTLGRRTTPLSSSPARDDRPTRNSPPDAASLLQQTSTASAFYFRLLPLTDVQTAYQINQIETAPYQTRSKGEREMLRLMPIWQLRSKHFYVIWEIRDFSCANALATDAFDSMWCMCLWVDMYIIDH